MDFPCSGGENFTPLPWGWVGMDGMRGTVTADIDNNINSTYSTFDLNLP
jgi:hypothetical protein